MGWQDRHKVVPAVYLILRQGQEVLLMRRAGTGYMDGMYSVPSGHLEGKESAEHAACREVTEEIGIDIRTEDLKLVHTMHRLAEEGDHERIDLFFEATKWKGEPSNAEPDKCDDVKWCHIDELPENTIPIVRVAIENATKGLVYSSQGFEI
jgi:mutator protein MutT